MQREVGGVVHIFIVNGKPGLHSKGRLQCTGILECTMTLLVLFFEAELLEYHNQHENETEDLKSYPNELYK
jgi:hypothetical protein